MSAALAASACFAEPPEASAGDAAASYARDIQPLLARYCSGCHADDEGASFRVAGLADPRRVRTDDRLTTRVLQMLRTSSMPPKDEPQPSPDERRQIIDWLEAQRAAGPVDLGDRADPGRVVMRRLSRYEYTCTVRDLFSLGAKTGWKYFVAPDAEIPEQGFDYGKRSYFQTWNLPVDEADYGFDNNGEVLTLPPHLLESYFEVAGDVVERVMADKRARKTVLLVLPDADTSETQAARENLSRLARGAFRRPVTDAEVQALVDLFTLARASGEPFDQALKIPLRAMLVSPDFLFRVERGTAPHAEHPQQQGSHEEPSDGIRTLNDFELASRLSYFLWSSLPDDELLRLADEGTLHEPQVLEQQVRRMLRDPKAEALAEHFAPQWLQVADVQTASPDPTLFPAFYRKSIPWAMRSEVIIFFDSVVVRDRSILDLVSADSTFLNAYLAEYYGLIKKPPIGREGYAFWRSYQLPEERRGGVLTMAAVATVTSTPTRSSPVKRGKWVLETILGDPPPPPPPMAEQFAEAQPGEAQVTLRQRLEQHRSLTSCAACHQHMDPLGFALENLDAIGRWRERDGDQPVDATGTLKDGGKIEGPAGLRDEILGRRKDDFTRCFTEHLLTYALGRKLEWYDRPTVERIVKAAEQDGYRFSTLAVEIAKSHPFRNTSAPLAK